MTLFEERRAADRPGHRPEDSRFAQAGTAPAPPPRKPAKRPLTEGEARRLRRLLFWWSLPVVLAAVFFGVKFLSLPAIAQSTIASYEAGDYLTSQSAASHLQTVNIVEPYLAYFDRGTAAAVGQNWVLGTDDLAKALDLAPDEPTKCLVRVNLARAYETQADQYVKAEYYQGAINLYETAKRIVDEGADCFPPQDEQDQQDQQDQSQDQQNQSQGDQGQQGDQAPQDQGQQGDPGDQGQQGDQDPQDQQGGQGQQNPDSIQPKQTPGENLKDTGDRIDRKRQGATTGRDQQNQTNGSPGQPGQQQPGDGSSGTGKSELDNKVDKLKDAGQGAEQDKSTEDAKNRGRNSDNGSFAERPW
ncbi:hypothetical protein [Plantibacter sp. YIM 135249]|uniref:hypothetical protein n=1 Tax=Plantibacter sp. YIM 135249 TaxID=3423918 RepID=UPI003D351661